MRNIIIAVVLLLNGIIIFYACKKEKTQELEFDLQTSQDNSLAESVFNDANNIASQAVENGTLSTYKLGTPQNTFLSSCANVTVTPDSGGSGGTVVVDFGPVNCRCQGVLCSDFRYRRGIIEITYTGPYRSPGTIITTTFNNYFVGFDTTNMYQVTGTKTVTNLGMNAANHLNYSISVNGQLINSGGSTMSWNSTRNREWITGENTANDWRDDEYVITGSANGTNFEGNSFTANITSGLLIALNCPYIKQGVFELTPAGKATRIFDYGNGTCDANASVTVNGSTFPITLR
jgi:hypothetical protein